MIGSDEVQSESDLTSLNSSLCHLPDLLNIPALHHPSSSLHHPTVVTSCYSSAGGLLHGPVYTATSALFHASEGSSPSHCTSIPPLPGSVTVILSRHLTLVVLVT